MAPLAPPPPGTASLCEPVLLLFHSGSLTVKVFALLDGSPHIFFEHCLLIGTLSRMNAPLKHKSGLLFVMVDTRVPLDFNECF
jgi:hypothetical protein